MFLLPKEGPGEQGCDIAGVVVVESGAPDVLDGVVGLLIRLAPGGGSYEQRRPDFWHCAHVDAPSHRTFLVLQLPQAPFRLVMRLTLALFDSISQYCGSGKILGSVEVSSSNESHSLASDVSRQLSSNAFVSAISRRAYT